MTTPDPYRPPTAPLAPPMSEQVAACPKCGAQSASKVGYNWWGGALGPRLFHVVKCNNCRAQYNGKTGGTLTKVIIIYQGTFLVIALVIFALLRS
jgi:hypothetical protein